MRRPIIPLDLFMAVVPPQEHDWLPLPSLEAPVDAKSLGLHLRSQVLIPLDARPAGRADLNERELSAVAGLVLQELLDPAKPLRDALRVIHPIDTDPHEGGLHAQLVEQLGPVQV